MKQLETAHKVGLKLTTLFLQQKQAQATLNQVGEALSCNTKRLTDCAIVQREPGCMAPSR
jgi:hypothetical protein